MGVTKSTVDETNDTPPKTENFAELLKESMGEEDFEGKVVKGTVLFVDNDSVLIDVGLKISIFPIHIILRSKKYINII